MVDIEALLKIGLDLVVLYTPKVLLALITLVVGLWIIKGITKVLKKALARKEIDVSLQGFLFSLVGIGLKILLFISVISMLGIQMTSFIAILGAAGLAVGLALQGSMSNFAGGVLILLFKPYKVGDFIDAQGYAGTVAAIQIFNTILKTPDNKTIIIPNGDLSNGSITNFSTESQRRVDFTFGIGYDDDFEKAKAIIQKLIEQNQDILKDPEPFLRVAELADSSVNIVARVWVKAEHYWDVNFYMIENVKLEFDKNGISIPYPQQDVHLYKHESNV